MVEYTHSHTQIMSEIGEIKKKERKEEEKKWKRGGDKGSLFMD